MDVKRIRDYCYRDPEYGCPIESTWPNYPTPPEGTPPVKIKVVRTLRIEYSDDDLSVILAALAELSMTSKPGANRAEVMRHEVMAALDTR